MSHTCYSRVFSSATRLLAMLECTTEAPHRQVAKRAVIIVSFSWATTILAEAITMIQTQRNDICTRAVHSYQSVFKELEVFGSDLLALSSERLPFHAIFVHNVTESQLSTYLVA